MCNRAPLRGHADLLNFITDGKTTKGEVLNSLGHPSGRFESEKILSYRLGHEPRNNGYYPVEREVALRGYWALTRFSLVLVFDADGVLRKHAVVPLYERPELLGFLADGTTTKEIALLELGHPSGWFESEKILTYWLGYEPKDNGYYLVERETTISGWPTWTVSKFSLVLVFDDAGLLRRHSLVKVNR